MRQQFIIAIAVFVTGYLAGTDWSSSGQFAEQSQNFAVAKRGELSVSISETGTLQALQSQRIFSGLQRQAKITYLIREGSRVHEGNVLARFNDNEIQREIKNIEQKIRAAEAKYETAKGELEIQRTKGESDIAKAELTHQEAQKNLEKYEKGDFPLAHREKQIKLEEAKATQKRKREKLEQMPELLKEGFVTADRVEQEKIEVRKAEVAYDTANRELELLLKYDKPLETEKRKAAIDKAASEWEAHKKQAEAKLKQKQVELDSLQLELENHRVELEKLQKEQENTVRRAPIAGLVIYGDPDESFWRNETIEVGKEVGPHSTIITLPNLAQMKLGVRIHEVDIRHITVGMPVTVTVESAKDLVTSGKVSKIAELASTNDTWGIYTEVKQFDVEITLDEENLPIKPGTTAKVDIVFLRLPDALYIPVESVRVLGEQAFCYAIEGQQEVQRREIEIGWSNDKFVEIRNGLKEGERVLTGTAPPEWQQWERQQRQKMRGSR